MLTKLEHLIKDDKNWHSVDINVNLTCYINQEITAKA